MRSKQLFNKKIALLSAASLMGFATLAISVSPVKALEVDGDINQDEYLINDQSVIQIGLGDRGAAIQDIQLFLQESGHYNGPIDGVYGVATQNAVASFQDKEELPVTGIIDSETLDAMDDGGLINDDPGLLNPNEEVFNDDSPL